MTLSILRATKALSRPSPAANFQGSVRNHDVTGGETEIEVARAAVAKGYNLVSVGYASKIMVKAASELLGQIFPHTAAN